MSDPMSDQGSRTRWPQKSTRRFLLVVLAYLIIGTLLWWIIGLAIPSGRTSNPPYGHPENESVVLVAPTIG